MISCVVRNFFIQNPNGEKLDKHLEYRKICGKYFKDFEFTDCKIIGLEVRRKYLFFEIVLI